MDCGAVALPSLRRLELIEGSMHCEFYLARVRRIQPGANSPVLFASVSFDIGDIDTIRSVLRKADFGQTSALSDVDVSWKPASFGIGNVTTVALGTSASRAQRVSARARGDTVNNELPFSAQFPPETVRESFQWRLTHAGPGRDHAVQ